MVEVENMYGFQEYLLCLNTIFIFLLQFDVHTLPYSKSAELQKVRDALN